jgi:Putative transposase
MPGAEPVLQDLGRSIHRSALTNRRLLALADGHGCVRSQDAQDQRWKPMTLPALACMRRLLPQVLPQGCHTVRASGLWSPVHRPLLHQRQLWLGGQHPPAPLEAPDRESQPSDSTSAPLQAGPLWLHGGQGWLVVIRQLPRHQRGPPCAPEPPCGLPRPASSGPRVPRPVASSHPSPLLPEPMAGHRLPPPLAALGSHPASGFSPLCPLRRITGTSLLISHMGFPSGAGCLTIPYGLAPRFRSTPFLWRLRATKTLIR